MISAGRPIPKSLILAALCGFVAAVLWLVAVRLVTYKTDIVHYHANFALYINGQRDLFSNFTFYEEVQSCGSSELDNPKTRVHMHNNKNSVVHVHDQGVTWEHFFANLGYTLGSNVIKTNQATFIDGQDGKKLSFILNGQPVTSVSNKVIGNQDVLLVSYGTPDQDTLNHQYKSIPVDAKHYNESNDPSSCAGSHRATFAERLRLAIF